MDLIWIEDFLALEECGSFSRAAERRHVTQPAFSRRIRALEDWVGTALFDRTSHRIVPTPAGQGFRREALELLRRASLAREQARDAGGRGTAATRFASTHLLASTFFPFWLAGIEAASGREFPFQFLVDTMTACERMMRRDDARLLLCHHHDRAPSELEAGPFRRIPLAADVLVPVSAPDGHGAPLHPLPDADPAAPPVAFLAHRPESGLARILGGSGVLPALDGRLRPVFHAHAALTLLFLARAGRGMTWIPRSAVAADLRAGTLVPASPLAGGWEIPIEVCLFRPRDRQDPALEEFLRRLRPFPDAPLPDAAIPNAATPGAAIPAGAATVSDAPATLIAPG